MPTEVLVMCKACGRPQPPKERCVQCDAVLPEAPASAEGTARDTEPALTAPQPPAEAPAPSVESRAEPNVLDLGGGRRLVLTSDALELQVGTDSDRVPVAQMRRVSLVQRRVWFFAIAAVLGGLFAGFVGSTGARIAVVAVAALNVFMWFRMREFAVRIDRKDGASTFLPLGQGGAAKSEQTQTVWSTVSGELGRRGVEVQR